VTTAEREDTRHRSAFGFDLWRPEPRIRLRNLILWRWLAVFGQCTTLFVVDSVLGYDVPLLWCLMAVTASAWLNIIVSLRYPFGRLLSDSEATGYLAYDLAQLSVLLFLTGGLANPFTLLFLVPVTIAATSLSLRSTLIMGALTIVAVTLLTVDSLPLPSEAGETLNKPAIYIAGNWVALIIGLVFLAGYAWRLAEEARRMNAALGAAQRALEGEQRLSAVGALAAAAAHELGTPLATIALVAKELAHELGQDGPHGEDLRLLLSQTQRCREILVQLLKTPSQEEAQLLSRLPIAAIIHEAMGPHEGFGVAIEIRRVTEDSTTPPVLRRSPELIHGLGNFIENAVDFAKNKVEIEIRWSAGDLWIRIIDDGPGFSTPVLDRLGEPYITTRGADQRRSASDRRPQSPHDFHERDSGMGLGVFIAKTLLERTGADISFANGARGGAIVAIHWKRELSDSPALEGLKRGETP
jgi:two-component system sensor histidine kinase RegB